MSKTIESMIFDSEVRWDFWLDVAGDPVALADLSKLQVEALVLANYFEGKRDAFIEARDIINGVDI